MVTLSRKRRCTRVLIVRRNHVAAADTPSPAAAAVTSVGRLLTTPMPSTISHSAISASGSAASCDSANAASISRGSWRYPSVQSRHIDDNAGGSGSIGWRTGVAASTEDVILHARFVFGRGESLCLQLEHRSIAPMLRHQLGVRAKLDDTPLLEHADSVRVADRREAM